MIRSSVFLAQPDAGFSPLSFRRLIGTASPGPGAHPRTRAFDSLCVRNFFRPAGVRAFFPARHPRLNAVDCILSPLRNHRHGQPSKKPVQPKFSFPLGQFCGGQLLRLLQSVSGIQFDIRLDPRAFPIGLGNGIHRAREWHSNHEVIVNAMP